MSISFIVRPSLHLVECNASGVLADADFRGKQEELKADPLFDPAYAQLWDLSAVTRFELSTAAVERIAATSIFLPDSLRAIIAPNDLGFGIARMFGLLSEGYGRTRIRIFRDRAAALSWLAAGSLPDAGPAPED
jgi:hypothetical protein